MSDDRETRAIAERYARRTGPDRYGMIRPEVWQSVQERQRVMLRLFSRLGFSDLSSLRALELGCGAGDNLLEMLRLGFSPANLCGVEMLPQRAAIARARLPGALTLIEGEASRAEIGTATQDIVLASTVFSSVLDDAFQQRMADAMWRWVRPGGGVLWYDFTVDNPRNRDVRGVPLRRVRELFPGGKIQARRLTLAPPVARAVARIHPSLYTLLNTLPGLQTHALAWIAKA